MDLHTQPLPELGRRTKAQKNGWPNLTLAGSAEWDLTSSLLGHKVDAKLGF